MLGLIFLFFLEKATLGMWWCDLVVRGRSYASSDALIIADLLEQIPSAITFLLLGAVMYLCISSKRKHWWALGMGVVAGLLLRWTTRYLDAPSSFIQYLRRTIEFLVPAPFAILGSIMAKHFLGANMRTQAKNT